MRTLDEVIEIASDWTNGFDESSIEKQMLYYLKMYRSDQEQWGFFQKNYEDELMQKIKDFGDAKERYIKRLKELDIGTLNEPLTWDELRTMEGKPVWIDSVPLVRRWVIIKKFHPIGGNNNLFDMEVEDGAHFLRKSMGRDAGAWWQAYRKERS